MFYFFCKNTDGDKNTSIAITQSLLYQMYRSVRDQKIYESQGVDIGTILDWSGQKQAVGIATLWHLPTHGKNLSPTFIILDECQDTNILVQDLKALSTLCFTNVIMTSRKEAYLDKQLSKNKCLEMTPEDINADIAAFVKTKALSSLSPPFAFFTAGLGENKAFQYLQRYVSVGSPAERAQVLHFSSPGPINVSTTTEGIIRHLQKCSSRFHDTLSNPTFDICFRVLT